MTALIIGGDNLGNIPGKLHQKGFDQIEHINGRKGGTKKWEYLSRLKRLTL